MDATGRELNGEKYWKYVLCYVDNVLAISMNPTVSMKGIQSKFKLKGHEAEQPESYLGAQLSQMTIARGQYVGHRVWTSMSVSPSRMLKNCWKRKAVSYRAVASH